MNSVNGIEVHQNILVAERGGYFLQADLHLPVRTARTGALVVVHGGGWVDCTNRRDDVTFYAQAIAEVLSIPTLNIEYRLSQEGGGYPENLMDVKCAVQWLRAHANDFDIDADRIGIMGTSAGAHLATMVALTEDRADLDPGCADVAAEVDLTVAYSTPADLPLLTASTSIAREAPAWYTGEDCLLPVEGCSEGRACSRCIDASPLAHACDVDDDPIILMQAPDPYDLLVPQSQTEALAAALAAAGGDVTVVIPSDEAMRSAGCTPEGGSHAADGCMLAASGDVVNERLLSRLGPL